MRNGNPFEQKGMEKHLSNSTKGHGELNIFQTKGHGGRVLFLTKGQGLDQCF